jgi:23S rRNA pseudouridine2605 synthase
MTSKRKQRGKPHHEIDQNYEADDLIRLNKYIAHAGFTSRRKADNYIAAGEVKVNGEVVTELGTKVRRRDRVEIDGEKLQLERFTYILLNKPKNTISTVKDTGDRRTVMHLIEDATDKRVYPVGRLDRNTTGVLILTNDGDLANRLMHPSYGVRKLYEVRTGRPLAGQRMQPLLY